MVISKITAINLSPCVCNMCFDKVAYIQLVLFWILRITNKDQRPMLTQKTGFDSLNFS
jgi:hypothetical protein